MKNLEVLYLVKVMDLKLSNNVRPVFDIYVNGRSITTLYDTGANISVWLGSRRLFEATFKDAILKREDYNIKGFGGPGTKYCLYKIPVFILSNGVEQYTIKNMLIAVGESKNYEFRLLLSAGVFYACSVTIDNTNHKRYLGISYSKDEYVMVIAENGNSTVVFTQDDEPIHPLLRAAKRGEVK